MRDCSSCSHRKELHPEYTTYENTPCAQCEINTEKKGECPFTPELNYNKIIAEASKQQPTLRYFVFMDSLSPMQRAVLKAIIDNPSEPKTRIAQLLCMTRRRLYQHLDRIKTLYKEALLPQ